MCPESKTFDTSNSYRYRRDVKDMDDNEENCFNDKDPSDKNKPLYNLRVVIQNKVFDTKTHPSKVIAPLQEKCIATPLEKVISNFNSAHEKVIRTPLEKSCRHRYTLRLQYFE